MTRRLLGCVAALVVCGMVGTAGAVDFAASAKVGFPGIGADVAVSFMDQLGCRVGVNYMPGYDITSMIDPGEKAADVIKDLNVEFGGMTAVALLDWFPMGNMFRVSAGMMMNDMQADITGTAESLTIAGRRYTLTQADGDVTFSSTCPYVGVGMGNAAGDGNWAFALDVGVMIHGGATVDLRATASDPIGQPYVDAEVERQEDDVQEDVDNGLPSVLPVVQAGVMYKF